MIRTKPLTRRKPLKRSGRKCSQARDANGMTPQLRDFALREIGCVVCALRGLSSVAGKHHLLTTGRHGTGKRRGEAFTVPLCDYHHQGSQVLGRAAVVALYPRLGPSYHDRAAEFRDRYPDDLLLDETEKALAQWRKGCV